MCRALRHTCGTPLELVQEIREPLARLQRPEQAQGGEAMGGHLDEAPEEKRPITSPSSPAIVHTEVDYGSPELPESDRGHVTFEPPSKDASDLHDWEMLSRNPSPSPERSDETKDSGEVAEADPQDKPVLGPSPTQEQPPHYEDISANPHHTEVAREDQAQEQSMTIDEIPELVKMMTEIQAALTEPEGSTEGDQPAEGMVEDAPAGAAEAPNEEIVQAIVTAIQEEVEHVQGDDMTERTPPDSPHVRSGVSSFSHISSPTSYQFSRDGDASDEEGSSWSSDEDDKSQRSGRRSEADSEEANQDVSALSQEGSLGSFSDSSFKLRMAAAAESSRTPPESGLPPAAKIGADPEGEATEDSADVEEVLKVTRCLREVVAELSGDEREGSEDDEGAMEEQRWDKKSASRRADVVGALRSGLDRLAEVSHNALAHVGSSDLLHRFWACLEEWMSALLNCLPAAQRARARLRMELDRMQARARRLGWSKIALIASLAIMAVVAGVAVVKNAALSRALRRKDQEMNQLIIMVFNLQESLQNAAAGSRVPIVRHASCGMSSFPAYGYPEPVSMLAFEALSGAVQC